MIVGGVGGGGESIPFYIYTYFKVIKKLNNSLMLIDFKGESIPFYIIIILEDLNIFSSKHFQHSLWKNEKEYIFFYNHLRECKL